VSGSNSEIVPEHDPSPVSKEAGDFLLDFDQGDACRDQKGAHGFSNQIAGGKVFASELWKKQREKNAESEDKEGGR
jgi:hypothetical protein